MRASPAIRIRFEVTGRIVAAGILEAAALLVPPKDSVPKGRKT